MGNGSSKQRTIPEGSKENTVNGTVSLTPRGKWIGLFLYFDVNIWMHVYSYAYKYVYICIYAYKYIHIYIYMYLYILQT
jgi:hypothetical protein